jgi:hypothetical protein
MPSARFAWLLAASLASLAAAQVGGAQAGGAQGEVAHVEVAQGGKKGGKSPGTGEGGEEKLEAAPVKVNIGAVPKSTDEAIVKNAEKSKKESEALSTELGGDFHCAQGTTVAIRAEEPLDRIQDLVRVAETMLVELSADLGVDPIKDLWAARLGPFQVYCLKSKASLSDALPYLEKRFPRHNLKSGRSMLLDIGRFIFETPSPLAGGEVDDYEHTLGHWMGQLTLYFLVRPMTAAPEKTDLEVLESESISWLSEGCAMYAAVRFLGSNRTYCVTDAKYVGKIAIANKDLDTAYRLVCLEMANGDEKSKDFALLTKSDTNALDYLDLAKSWSFFDWMMRDENRPKLVAVLKGMRSGSFAASLKKNAGMSLEDLEAKWKAFVTEEYGGKKKAAAPPAKGKAEKPDKKPPKSKP